MCLTPTIYYTFVLHVSKANPSCASDSSPKVIITHIDVFTLMVRRVLLVHFTVANKTWLTVTEYLCHRWPRLYYTCRNHNPLLSSLMI